MYVDKNRDVAFAECRSERLDRWAGPQECAESADDKIESASRFGLSRQVVTVCPDLGVGNEGAEQAQISSLIADSRKSSFRFIGFA